MIRESFTSWLEGLTSQMYTLVVSHFHFLREGRLKGK